MTDYNPVTGKQIAAGRVLAGIGRDKLALRAKVPAETLQHMEASEGPPAGSAHNIAAVQRALEDFGVVFIAENGGGAGVRLKFTRSEVKQIRRLENEGGPAADDDV